MVEVAIQCTIHGQFWQSFSVRTPAPAGPSLQLCQCGRAARSRLPTPAVSRPTNAPAPVEGPGFRHEENQSHRLSDEVSSARSVPPHKLPSPRRSPCTHIDTQQSCNDCSHHNSDWCCCPFFMWLLAAGTAHRRRPRRPLRRPLPLPQHHYPHTQPR